MRIAVDARLLYYRRAGIGRYTLCLLQALTQAAPQEQFLLLHDWRQRGPLLEAANLRHAPIYTPSHHRWEETTLPIELFPLRLDLVHSPDFVLPTHRAYAGVVTIHDLAFIRFPDLVTAGAASYYGRVRQAVRSAERVIAVSERTRRDVLELLDVEEDKVVRIYEAAETSFRPLALSPEERRTIKGRHLVPERFAFFVGTIEPRKNLPTLLRAFRRMLDLYPDLEPHPRLVIAGEQGWLSQPTFGLVHELKLAQEVAFVGAVTQEELIWLHNAARFLVLPSLYEGFGLPALEAMACGTPVIASNAGALPEVIGQAGRLVDPQDVDGWAEQLAHLWTDDDLREELRARGLQRASQFSWSQAAQETLSVYRQAAALRRQGGHG